MARVLAAVLALALGVAAGPTSPAASITDRGTAVTPGVKAVAFDYLALFDPDSIVADVDAIVPGKGREFAGLWRTRQFEYTWLRSSSRRYVDFRAVTEDALVYTARAMGLEITGSQRSHLLAAYLHLAPWPDAVDGLRRLRQLGIQVVTISNFTPVMQRASAERAGILGLFDALVSTDDNHTYKPDPRAYQLVLDRLGLARHEIVFAAFAAWDAAGAKAFGYPTVWVNRLSQPEEELGVRPDRTVANLDGLLAFVQGQPSAPDRRVRRSPEARP
ncbi:MAG: haloacid dehalogenase type II [Vicinamibacterales bacterium]